MSRPRVPRPYRFVRDRSGQAEPVGVILVLALVIVSTTDRGSILVKSRVTPRPAPEEVFMPYHWGGIAKGESLLDKYPDGNEPFAILFVLDRRLGLGTVVDFEILFVWIVVIEV